MKYMSAIFLISLCFGSIYASDYHISDSTAIIATDSLSAARTEIRAEPESDKSRMRLVQRKFDYKGQVFLAAGMMAFVALIMTTAQTWNPD